MNSYYAAGFTSISKTVALAKGWDAKRVAFRNGAHEALTTWHGIERDEVIDELQHIADAQGLLEQFGVTTIQQDLADEVERATTAPTNGGSSTFAEACAAADAERARKQFNDPVFHADAPLHPDPEPRLGAGDNIEPCPTARTLMSMTFPPIKHVVPEIIVEGLTLFAGKPKIGKSWLLLHAAVAVASGGFTLGNIHCPAGDVLYCALEDNLRRLQSRLTKLLGTQLWPERLHFRCEMPRLAQGGLIEIKLWISSVPHARLIIIDTLAMVRAPKGKEQTQYDADYAAVMELRELASQHGLAVVVVHHLRKAEADDAFDTVSGTLGLTGAPDTILVIKHDRNGTVILHGRGRDLVEIEKAMMFNKDACTWTITGQAANVDYRSVPREAILAALEDIGQPASIKQIVDNTGLNATNVRRMVERMTIEGAIRRAERGRYQVAPSVS